MAGFNNETINAIPTYVPSGNGDGIGGLGGIAALALLFGLGGRGAGFGAGAACCDTAGGNGAPYVAAILNSLNQIAADVPKSALETQGALNSAISSLALGVSQGLASVKDTIVTTGTANLLATNQVNTSVLTSALQTVIAIGNDGDKTRAQGQEIKDLINSVNTSNLQRELTVAQEALARHDNHARLREVEVNVTQTVNQQQIQAQAQLQQQQQANFLAGILAEVRNLAGDIQAVKQGQVIFNSGTMAASGTQAAANTKVA